MKFALEAYLTDLDNQRTEILNENVPQEGESVKGTDTKAKGNLKLATVDGRKV